MPPASRGAAGRGGDPRQDRDDGIRHPPPRPTSNPHNPRTTPGGSSSGSAAGAAAGYFHAGFGTQTAGSIIRPAAYCGAVGFKPSYGTLHRAGMKVMSESLDTIGVITRTVGDAALVMAGLTGRRLRRRRRPARRAAAPALCWGPTAAEAKPETRALLDRVAAAAARAGATIEPLEMPPAVVAGLTAHALVMNGKSAEALGWELDAVAALLSPGLRERMDMGPRPGRRRRWRQGTRPSPRRGRPSPMWSPRPSTRS